MTDPAPRSIRELVTDHELIAAAVARAVRQAVLEHARLGFPVASSQDGKVVWISPEEILARYADESSPQDGPK